MKLFYKIKCDTCNNEIELSSLSSAGINDVTKFNWEYRFSYKEKGDDKIDTKVTLTCDNCILMNERKNKIKKFINECK